MRPNLDPLPHDPERPTVSKPAFLGQVSRRSFLRATGLAAAGAASASLVRGLPGSGMLPRAVAAPIDYKPNVVIHLAATDGFIYIPGHVETAVGSALLPDPLAPAPLTTYAFGFRNVTSLGTTQIQAQRGQTQASAPMLFVDELDNIQINLTNLGLSVRPDLTDSHTIHWHGFRNAIPLFDGVPEMSIAVPIGREFPYFYHPHDAGTYMYHCHFEDVEHVSMGMTGIVFVRAAQNRTGNVAGAPKARLPIYGGPASAPMGYAYNDGVLETDVRSTAYDREWGIFLSEMWAQERFNDAHIQENDWSDYEPDAWLMNGRSYPDTIEPSGGGVDLGTGDLIAPAGRPDLQWQPISTLINVNAGDRVLLRFVTLGYRQAAMTIDGITMRVVGKDATYLSGRDGTDTSYATYSVYIGPGESTDAIFKAPATAKTGTDYDTYLLYNRNFANMNNPGLSGLGGQVTEIRVYEAGHLPAQAEPNT